MTRFPTPGKASPCTFDEPVRVMSPLLATERAVAVSDNTHCPAASAAASAAERSCVLAIATRPKSTASDAMAHKANRMHRVQMRLMPFRRVVMMSALFPKKQLELHHAPT